MIFHFSNFTSTMKMAYNSTQPVLQHTLTGLQAGTLYFVMVSACTGGGCRRSAPSIGRTQESAPEGVPPPRVVSPDPNTLLVKWRQPKFPNGKIERYLLFHNRLLAANSTADDPKEHNVTNLEPWTPNVFYLQACTAKGCGTGPEVSAWTQEAPPIGIVRLAVSSSDLEKERIVGYLSTAVSDCE